MLIKFVEETCFLWRCLFRQGDDKHKCHELFFSSTTEKEINHSFNTNQEVDPPKCTRDQLVEIMKTLTESDSGFLYYSDLCERFGKQVVNSAIEYNSINL